MASGREYVYHDLAVETHDAQAGHIEYLIKWAGYTSDQNSWEREECALDILR